MIEFRYRNKILFDRGKVKKTRLGLQCQTPTSYLYLTQSFGFLFPQKIVVLKNFWSKKNLFTHKKIFNPKKFLAQKKFWVPKKILVQKNVGSKKQSMAENQFLVEISFWLLKILSQNIFGC